MLLFGSQASGETHKESDIDIAILPELTIDFNKELEIHGQLVMALGDKTDFVNLRTAPPLLMKQIIDNCQVLYEREPTIFHCFEVYALHRYAEAEPLFQITREKVRAFVKATA